MHEYGGARRDFRFAEEITDQRKPVAGEVYCGGEVPEHVLVALFRDGRGGCDVDDKGNAALLGNLRDRRGRTGVERADQDVGAFLDQALGARAGGVDVAFGVGIHEFDVGAKQFLDDTGGEVRTLLAGLADETLEAGTGQEHTHFQLAALAARDAEG